MMDIDYHKTYAVITGDVIGSSKLSEEKRLKLYQVMKDGCAELRSAFAGIIPLDIDIFRGDSWQMLISDFYKSLRIALIYRLYVRTGMNNLVDTRMAIGIGPISFIPGNRVSEGEGAAFRLSGQALEEMPDFCAIGFNIQGAGDASARFLNSVTMLVDAVASRWTEKQALAVYGALREWPQKRIAGLWEPPITQQTVAKYLKSARWPHMRYFFDLFEEIGLSSGFLTCTAL